MKNECQFNPSDRRNERNFILGIISVCASLVCVVMYFVYAEAWAKSGAPAILVAPVFFAALYYLGGLILSNNYGRKE